ncbi:lactate/malate dehydrogenase, NAD binding domain/lactate/malate dehydrogenase, alpha/beta C-terminal domain containing protein, putative [Angomonas deanei]|uniref:Malate dehydrogenase n=1 Tax=Angomonas deanei TaxID=59799 RepID=A0A7G2CBS8_9TRYP|nr:lactate/malate dehydrogenase, NAD binding domain/lactate/malate dehydrogenase, alpha/beta C-terminal domain containing protein, putative [Angomonas deanei]
MRVSTSKLVKVAVLGAAGGIGQNLALLLKGSPLVSQLSLYDVRGAVSVALDIDPVASPAKVLGFEKDELEDALLGAEVVLIPAGVPRKPGMTRDDLFNTNASIVRDLSAAVAKSSPKAIIGVISNPVNSTVPIVAETLKKAGVYDPRKLFGITTLDIVRARTYVAEALGASVFDIDVPVIGGHSGETIVPLLSRFRQLSEEQVKALTHRIQFGGDEVVKAKAGAGSATLSMAYAASEWTFSVIKALRGDRGLVEYTYVASDVQPPCGWFVSPVELGKDGVENILPFPELNEYETSLLENALKLLESSQQRGIDFVAKSS